MSSVVLCAWLSVVSVASPNIILLSADTLRADHLGCYGYKFNTSPALDGLAKESLLFEDCVCEVPLTLPSFGSIFSSLYPRMTGTTRNGLRMPENVPLITEIFQQGGYETVCVQSNWPLKHHLSGLDRGFDVYDDNFHKKRWGFMKPERDARKVTDTALELVARHDPAKPFFMWVHYSDPHAPYGFHRDFNPAGGKLWKTTGDERIPIKYDSEIAYMDSHIARLLSNVSRDTAIVFVADHGESLFEHNYLGHGRRIYQDNEHVPFMVRAPGIAPGRSKAPVCTIDVGPTLLGLAGLAPAPGMLGRNALAPIPAVRSRVVETYGGAVPKIPGVHALLADRPPMRQGLFQEGWKLIIGGEEPELYYLPKDPGELNNLAGAEAKRVQEFRKIIETWNKAHLRGKVQEAELSKEDTEALKSLGYLQ